LLNIHVFCENDIFKKNIKKVIKFARTMALAKLEGALALAKLAGAMTLANMRGHYLAQSILRGLRPSLIIGGFGPC
jgi:hypothetical protein